MKRTLNYRITVRTRGKHRRKKGRGGKREGEKGGIDDKGERMKSRDYDIRRERKREEGKK